MKSRTIAVSLFLLLILSISGISHASWLGLLKRLGEGVAIIEISDFISDFSEAQPPSTPPPLPPNCKQI